LAADALRGEGSTPLLGPAPGDACAAAPGVPPVLSRPALRWLSGLRMPQLLHARLHAA
jgi:hypothetical protein